MRPALTLGFTLLLCWAAIPEAAAHESQPASLELRQLTPERYEVIWRAPIYYGRPHPARLALPEQWKDVVVPNERALPDSLVVRRVVAVGTGDLEGSRIRFPGLEKTLTDVFVRLNRLDGTTMTLVAKPSRPYAEMQGQRLWHAAARDYLRLGFEHILSGLDHLLFVLGLLMIVSAPGMLLKTITAFTIAHSITLGIATLGFGRAPLPPLNATIALSILFLAPEVLRVNRGETSLTIRYPWMVAFLFGLLHGFGFASGLSTAGMSGAQIPLALLFFNLGVEIGQVAFILVVLSVLAALHRLKVRFPGWAEPVPAYVLGTVGAFWFIQRFVYLLA
ncbi:MAG: HupE/UreJ family protein [Desulfobacterales bacterium]